MGQSLLQKLHANTDLDQPDVISVGPEVEVGVADHEAAFSGRRWFGRFEDNRLNGRRPFENVVAKRLVGVDALLDVGEESVGFDGVGDDDATLVNAPESVFPPKGGDTFANLSPFQVVMAVITVVSKHGLQVSLENLLVHLLLKNKWERSTWQTELAPNQNKPFVSPKRNKAIF